jgi:hypothetical protein
MLLHGFTRIFHHKYVSHRLFFPKIGQHLTKPKLADNAYISFSYRQNFKWNLLFNLWKFQVNRINYANARAILLPGVNRLCMTRFKWVKVTSYIRVYTYTRLRAHTNTALYRSIKFISLSILHGSCPNFQQSFIRSHSKSCKQIPEDPTRRSLTIKL